MDEQTSQHRVWSAPGQCLSNRSSQLGLGIGLVYLFLLLQQWRQGEISLLYTWMAGWLVTSSVADVLPAGWWRAAGILRLTSELVFVVGLGYGLWWLRSSSASG